MSAKFFESLESRRHLSAVLSGQEPGMLIIFGRTPGDDLIQITRQSNGRIRVDDNGTVKTFASSDVTKIWAVGGTGDDKISMNANLNIPATLDGGDGNDTLYSGDGADWILGGPGNDRISARSGTDHIYADAGHDFVEGGAGGDTIRGDAGNDSLIGNAGNDSIEGNDGKDVLVAVGGGQHDSVRGNAGADVFWVDSESTEKVQSPSSADTTHRIDKFKDLTIHRGAFNDDTTPVSRNLGGQSLPDPIADESYEDFSHLPLFTPSGPSKWDVQQADDVHDCYFLSTLAAIADKHPHIISRNIVDFGDGTYGVVFRSIWGKEFIRVDGDLAVKDNGNPRYADTRGDNKSDPADDSLWVAIMEKAWAFFRRNEGTYESIAWGSPTEAFDILGVNKESFNTPSTRSSLIARVDAELAAGRAVLGSTTPDAGDNVEDLASNHLYYVERLNKNSAGEVTSVRLHNPYGFTRTITPGEFFANFDYFVSGAV